MSLHDAWRHAWHQLRDQIDRGTPAQQLDTSALAHLAAHDETGDEHDVQTAIDLPAKTDEPETEPETVDLEPAETAPSGDLGAVVSHAAPEDDEPAN